MRRANVVSKIVFKKSLVPDYSTTANGNTKNFSINLANESSPSYI